MADTPNTPILPEGEEHELLSTPPEELKLTAPEEHQMLASGDETLLIEPGQISLDTPTEIVSETPPVISQTADISSSVAQDIQSVDFDAIDDVPEPRFPQMIMVEPEGIQKIVPEEPLGDAVMSDIQPDLPSEVMQTDAPSPLPHEEIIPPITLPSHEEVTQHFEVHTAPALPTKSNKKLIIGGVVFLILMLIGVGAWALFSQNNAKPKADVLYTISSEDAPDSTYVDSIAEKVKQDEQDIVYMNQAMTAQDALICTQIQSEIRKSECSESISAIKFSLSGSLTDCDTLTLPDIRSKCISTLSQKEAIATMNKSLCNSITDTIQVQYCRDSIDERILKSLIETKTATPENCNALESKYRESCLTAVVRVDDNAILQDAIKDDNLDTCKSLSTEDLQFTCFDTILLKRALTSKDKNLCDLIRDTTKKASCVSYTSQQDDNTVFKNAIVDKNLSACTQIGSEALKNRCNDSVILLIVRDTKDATLCDKLVNTETLASCQKTAGN